jgi:Cu+-exporting ATPase
MTSRTEESVVANHPHNQTDDHAHCPHQRHGGTAKDPVCGMDVDPATTPHRHETGGTAYFFCSGRCREKFSADPDRYLSPSTAKHAESALE